MPNPDLTVICIHGSGIKPASDLLQRFWHEALTGGFERDRPDLAATVAGLDMRFVYYGDLSREIDSDADYDEPLDIADREAAIEPRSDTNRTSSGRAARHSG